MAMACVAALLVFLLAAAPAYATDYTVGDSQGWAQGIDYSTWTSDKTFVVGDTLLFQYGVLHSVDEVSKSDYAGCSSSNAVQSYNDQNTKVTLSSAGTRYFICGTSGHCTGGMKLAVTVSSGTTPSATPVPSGSTTPNPTPTPTPTTPSGGSSPSDPSTPSVTTPATPNTPSTPAATNNAASGRGNVMVLGALAVGVALLA